MAKFNWNRGQRQVTWESYIFNTCCIVRRDKISNLRERSKS